MKAELLSILSNGSWNHDHCRAFPDSLLPTVTSNEIQSREDNRGRTCKCMRKASANLPPLCENPPCCGLVAQVERPLSRQLWLGTSELWAEDDTGVKQLGRGTAHTGGQIASSQLAGSQTMTRIADIGKVQVPHTLTRSVQAQGSRSSERVPTPFRRIHSELRLFGCKQAGCWFSLSTIRNYPAFFLTFVPIFSSLRTVPVGRRFISSYNSVTASKNPAMASRRSRV
jgi:hypothetical protein